MCKYLLVLKSYKCSKIHVLCPLFCYPDCNQQFKNGVCVWVVVPKRYPIKYDNVGSTEVLLFFSSTEKKVNHPSIFQLTNIILKNRTDVPTFAQICGFIDFLLFAINWHRVSLLFRICVIFRIQFYRFHLSRRLHFLGFCLLSSTWLVCCSRQCVNKLLFDYVGASL